MKMSNSAGFVTTVPHLKFQNLTGSDCKLQQPAVKKSLAFLALWSGLGAGCGEREVEAFRSGKFRKQCR